MGSNYPGGMGYVIPRYRAADEVSWYHVLHGNVPEHQIDFMYCPEVPQGRLTATHFSHLARLMKYIEPQTRSTHAFAIGNLSRDDTQYEAGHGAVGLIFGLRIGGTTDHAGRGNPPFAHGLIAVDRELSYAALLEASATFYRHLMNASEANSSAAVFYREYVGAVLENSVRVGRVLEQYVDEFGDLPHLARSGLSWGWVADESAQPKRVIIVHADDEPFGSIAHAAAKIATTLYRSNIKWTSITTGREADIPGGVSVRFVGAREVTAEDRHAMIVRIEDVGQDEGEIAREIFKAKPFVGEVEKPRYAGWREIYAAKQTGGAQLMGGGEGAAVAPAAAPSSRRFRKLPSGPPGSADMHRSEGQASVGAGVRREAEKPSVPPGPRSSRDVGPKGTQVIDREKLLHEAAARNDAQGAGAVPGGENGGRERLGSVGATGRLEPARAAAVAGGPVGGMAEGAGTTMRVVGSLEQTARSGGGGGGPGNVPGRAAVGAGATAAAVMMATAAADEIPVTVENAKASRTWIWAAVGLGCAALIAVGIAIAVTSSTPEEQPVTPTAPGNGTGSAATPAPPSRTDGSAPTGATASGSPAGTASGQGAPGAPDAGSKQGQSTATPAKQGVQPNSRKRPPPKSVFGAPLKL